MTSYLLSNFAYQTTIDSVDIRASNLLSWRSLNGSLWPIYIITSRRF